MFVRGMCISTLWSFQNQCRIQKYFHVGRNLSLIHFEYVQRKALHVEGNKTPKANLKCTCRFTRLLNLDTVCMMSELILTVRHLSL